MKRLFAIFAVMSLVVVGGVASANGQETCPEGNGWTKVDNLSGLTYTFTPPVGFEVVESCYKASTSVVFGTSATVTSEVFNSPQGVTCTEVGVPHQGCNYQELSHASFLVRAVTDPNDPEEPEDPEVPETPDTPKTTVVPVDDTPIVGK